MPAPPHTPGPATDAPRALPGRLVLRAQRPLRTRVLLRILPVAMLAAIVAVLVDLHESGRLVLAWLPRGGLAVAVLVGIAAWVWASFARFSGERLTVARDGVHYRVGSSPDAVTRRVLSIDRSTGALCSEGDEGAIGRAWGAIPGLPSEPAAREVALDRIERSLTRRRRLVDDSLLQGPTLAAIRAELGVVGAGAGPFRGPSRGLSAEDASRLLDDLAASRSELLAAALVLGARGGADDRRRIEGVADDCDDPLFGRLLRAVASGDPREESAYESFRRQAGVLQRFVGAVGERLVELVLLNSAASFVIGRTAAEPIAKGLAVVAVLGELRRWAQRRNLLGRWAGLRVGQRPPWQVAASLLVTVFALWAVPAGSVPAAIVPLLLYAAFWLPSVLGLRRVAPSAPADEEGVAPELADETRPDEASPRTGVRIDDEATAEVERSEEAEVATEERVRAQRS